MSRKILLPLVGLAWIVFWIISSTNILQSQTEGQPGDPLIIEHQFHSKRQLEVAPGKVVKVVRKDNVAYRGKLVSAEADSLRVDSVKFAYSDINELKVPNAGLKGLQVGGLVFWIVGLIGLLAGMGMVLLGTSGYVDNGDACSTLLAIFFLIVLGVIIASAGGILFIVGLVTYIVGMAAGKSFKSHKWKYFRKAKP